MYITYIIYKVANLGIPTNSSSQGRVNEINRNFVAEKMSLY